jgi:hypothetical protein
MCVCVFFLLQDLVQSCLRGGGGYWRTCATRDDEPRPVCVYYCSTYYKAVREGGGGNGGHLLRETTSQDRCELVCPSRTNERGGEGYCDRYCVKEGAGEEGERERERAGEVRLYYSLGY